MTTYLTSLHGRVGPFKSLTDAKNYWHSLDYRVSYTEIKRYKHTSGCSCCHPAGPISPPHHNLISYALEVIQHIQDASDVTERKSQALSKFRKLIKIRLCAIVPDPYALDAIKAALEIERLFGKTTVDR